MPSLDYGRQSRSRIPRWPVRCAIGLTAVVAIYLLGLMVPLHKASQAFMSRTCGRAESRVTWRIAGTRVWRRTSPLRFNLEEAYDRMIGIPHQHQWFSYAVTGVHGNLREYGSIGEGGPNEPVHAVRTMIEAIEMSFAHLPQEKRRLIFSELQQWNTRQDVAREVFALERKYPLPR